MGIMVMTVSAACGDKREKAESETLKTKNIVNESELIAETEKVSKVENSKDNEKIQQNTEPVKQTNIEQIKPDKADIQSSPSTENETKNDDEKNDNNEKKSDVMEEENPDYHASGGESDVSDNPADEYNALVEYLNDTIENKINVSGNIGLVVDRLLKELPVNAENAAAIIKEFDPEQFQNVIQFAQAANGNRPIE